MHAVVGVGAFCLSYCPGRCPDGQGQLMHAVVGMGAFCLYYCPG